MLLKLYNRLAALLLVALGRTWHFSIIGQAPAEPAIYSLWHCDLLILIFLRRNEGVVTIVSSSKDGALVDGPLQCLGYKTVRGSSTRGGSRAVRELLQQARGRNIAVTADGPKGPRFVTKEGTVFLARITKQHVVPVTVQVNKMWQLHSWDRLRIPKPWAKITVNYHSQLILPPELNLAEQTQWLQKILTELTKKAGYATE